MREFESMIIIAPELSEKEADTENEKVTKLIEENGGEITQTDKWGRKELAYEIQKKKEGYYYINYFKLDPSKTDKITTYYRFNEKIIRFNMLNKD